MQDWLPVLGALQIAIRIALLPTELSTLCKQGATYSTVQRRDMF